MNIDDTNSDTIIAPPPELIWPEIFRHQIDLASKYISIEGNNGFYHPPLDGNFSLDDKRNQAWIKDMFWRITEEIGEAFEDPPVISVVLLRAEYWDKHSQLRHFFEELADALHFFVEVSAFCLFNPDELRLWWDEHASTANVVKPNWDTIKLDAFEFVKCLGVAANCLKNKPWKTTQMQTDQSLFRLKLQIAWREFFIMWQRLRVTPEVIYQLYCRKNKVNEFRVRTQY